MRTYEEYRLLVENCLEEIIPDPQSEKDGLAKAMRYSLLAGGKRVRPVLTLAFADMLGADLQQILPVACALEMIHTYSLIHDDLPCMDDDELRRGKPTNHVVFGECTATLAGDALQSLAFQTLLSAPLESSRLVCCGAALAEAAGCRGMCYGQFLDMMGEGKLLTAEELDEINNNKTGALLGAACLLGAAAAGADERQRKAAESFGVKLGLAFQIRDDMLDVLSTDEELGKPVGSDKEEQKNTYMALYGESRCAKLVHELTENAVEGLEAHFAGTDFLVSLARSLENRKK
mgnify:CR=1 FL=1